MKRLPIVLWILPILLLVLLFWPTVNLPFERDEGEYAYAARVWSEGGLPYRDSFMQKPPGILVVYRTLLGVGATSPQAVHLALLAIYMGTTVLLGLLTHRLGGNAPLAMTLYALALIEPVYHSTALNTEMLIAPCLLIAYLALWSYRTRPEWQALLAMALGCTAAVLLKQTAAVMTFPVLAGLVAFAPRDRRIRDLSLFLLTAAIPWLGILVFWAVRGALPDFVDAVLWHNLEYVTKPLDEHGLPALRGIGRRMSGLSFFTWLAAPLAALALRGARGWLLGGWLVMACVAISAGGYYQEHYFLQGLPVAVILVALWLGRWRPIPRAAAAGVLLGAWLVASPWPWGKSLDELHWERYRTHRFLNAVPLARRLHDVPAGSVFVLGSEPELLYYSGRQSVTRYVIANPLFGGFSSSARRQAEVWAALQREPPAAIVTVRPHSIPMFSRSDSTLYRNIRALLARDYERVATVRDNHLGLLPPDASSPIDMALYVRNPDGSVREADVDQWEP